MTGPAAVVVETSWRPASSAQRQALLALLFAPADSAPPTRPVLAPGSGDGRLGAGAAGEAAQGVSGAA